MSYYQSSRRPSRFTPAPVSLTTAVANMATFATAHFDEAQWIGRNRKSFDFAGSLATQVERKGTLSEGQIAAVRRCMERNAANAAARATVEANAPECSVIALETAFASAKAAGVARPKLVFANFKFSPAPVTGRNPGAIYVKDREGTYLGKVADQRFVRCIRSCTPEVERDILEVCADPHTAAIAYGKKFGVCCVCNRTLTVASSIAAGIGPVCVKRMGWS